MQSGESNTSEPVSATTENALPKEEDFMQAFQIISISTDGTSFVLNEDNLKIVMDQVKKLEHITKRLVIVSVVGAFRTGKSFLLSTFIRYLEYCKEKGHDSLQDKPGDASWLKSSEHFTVGSSGEKTSPGFTWRGGNKRTTTGMWIYGVPYVRTLPGSNEKAVVLLMDTQGMFDMETSPTLTAAIFGLSSLISSYQIFNVLNQIQENVLDELDLFSSLSMRALKIMSENKDSSKEENTSQNEEENLAESKEGNSPFQRLEFLIRDYPHFEDVEDIPGSLGEMDAYLTEVLSEREHDDEGIRDRIKKTFQDISIFLLTHPGSKMGNKKWDGDLKVIDENFITFLDYYVRRVFEENIAAKKMQGRAINASSFEHYIKAYIEVFAGGKVPEARSLVQAIGDATNVVAKEDALSMYAASMKTSCQSFLGEDEMEKIHQETLTRILAEYDAVALMGSPTAIADVKNSLLIDIKQKYQDYKERNKLLLHAGLEKYVIPLIAAVFAFLLDYATDFICDSWSETCRKISRVMFFIYFIVCLVILIELAKIYNNSGFPTMSMAFLNFFRATIQRAKEINDDHIQPLIKKVVPTKKQEKEKKE